MSGSGPTGGRIEELDATPGPVAARQEQRRRAILASARHLLRDQGWHAVAIDQIAAGSGLTGPAVYRYFESKQDLLSTAMRHAAEELWSSLPPGDPPLAALVDSHVRFVLAHADLVEVWYREARHLPAEELRHQRRLQRCYIERWVDALVLQRPDLRADEARIMVRAAIGLIHSVAHSEDRQDPEVVRTLLVDMALAGLRAGPPGRRGGRTGPGGEPPGGAGRDQPDERPNRLERDR